jgi:HEAT repeat protein
MATSPNQELLYRNQPLQYWLDALESDQPALRDQAATVWRQIGQAMRNSAALMIARLRENHPVGRAQAVEALRDLGEQVQAVVPAVRSALKEVALTDTEEAVRTNAFLALTQIDPQSKSPVPALIEALKDELPSVRFAAASSLADLGGEARAATTALIQALRDSDSRVRVQAAVALWRIDRRDRIAVPVLSQALQERDEFLRWIAADCLGEIGADAREAVPLLLQAVRGDFKVALIRKGLLLALERIDPEAAARAGGP